MDLLGTWINADTFIVWVRIPPIFFLLNFFDDNGCALPG